jgi:hypothetical protein
LSAQVSWNGFGNAVCIADAILKVKSNMDMECFFESKRGDNALNSDKSWFDLDE